MLELNAMDLINFWSEMAAHFIFVIKVFNVDVWIFSFK